MSPDVVEKNILNLSTHLRLSCELAFFSLFSRARTPTLASRPQLSSCTKTSNIIIGHLQALNGLISTIWRKRPALWLVLGPGIDLARATEHIPCFLRVLAQRKAYLMSSLFARNNRGKEHEC